MSPISKKIKHGTVYLVGAGPGDPGLLTLKGKKALEQADVVLYDHLSSIDLLDWAPEQAEFIDVGKERGHPKLQQKDIHSVMIDRARKGLNVVRLKGGDPLVFGRGGEEGIALEQAEIPYILVPGVSSAISGPAYAGVPVSHRDTNPRITIMTNHGNPDRFNEEEIAAMALAHQTLVIMMGVEHIGSLAQRLIRAGRDPLTPAVIIRWATTAFQKVWESTLEGLATNRLTPEVKPPAVIVIGESASGEVRLSWTRNLSLFGKTILLTREREQALSLKETLIAQGAEILLCPTIRITPPDQWTETDLALEQISRWDFIVFLSPNGVGGFMGRLLDQKKDLRVLHGRKIVSLGPQTTRALAKWGIVPDVVALESHGKGVLESMKRLLSQGEKVLLVRGDRGDRSLPDGLRGLGANVTVISCYRNVVPRLLPHVEERIQSLLREKVIDAMVFYSPSAVTNLLSLFPDLGSVIRETSACAIGPTTRKALESEGFSTIETSTDTTLEAMVQTIKNAVVRDRQQ